MKLILTSAALNLLLHSSGNTASAFTSISTRKSLTFSRSHSGRRSSNSQVFLSEDPYAGILDRLGDPVASASLDIVVPNAVSSSGSDAASVVADVVASVPPVVAETVASSSTPVVPDVVSAPAVSDVVLTTSTPAAPVVANVNVAPDAGVAALDLETAKVVKEATSALSEAVSADIQQATSALQETASKSLTAVSSGTTETVNAISSGTTFSLKSLGEVLGGAFQKASDAVIAQQNQVNLAAGTFSIDEPLNSLKQTSEGTINALKQSPESFQKAASSVISSPPVGDRAVPYMTDYLKSIQSDPQEIINKVGEGSTTVLKKTAESMQQAAAGAIATPSPPAEGRVPLMTDYLKTITTTTAPQIPQMYQNAPKSIRLEDVPTEIGKFGQEIGKLAADAPELDTARRGTRVLYDNAEPVRITLSSLIESLDKQLHIKENAVWYVAGLGLALAAYAKELGREEADRVFQKELKAAQERADEAVSEALKAAEEAQAAKTMADSLSVRKKGADGGGGIGVLNETKMKQMEVEKEFMKKEMDKLTSEVATLQTQLKQVLASQTATSTPIHAKPVDEITFYDSDDATTSGVNARGEKDPEDDMRILEVLKELDQENRMARGKPGIMQIEAEAKAAAAKKEKKKKKKKTTDEAINGATAAKKDVVTKATKTRRKTTKKTAKVVTDDDGINGLAPVNGSAASPSPEIEITKPSTPTVTVTKSKTSKTKKTKISKKETAAAAAEQSYFTTVPMESENTVNASNTDDHPWKKLAMSTLSRKTVKELSAYLEERGVPVTNDSGKTLLKKELVSAVKECC
mmetsp:Transcript_2722/g.3579  ORF Transcript_2722/g.3579 Transcript_2722/m.3579 type:complete len:807 (+) Transcript_2722:178-2598(+)